MLLVYCLMVVLAIGPTQASTFTTLDVEAVQNVLTESVSLTVPKECADVRERLKQEAEDLKEIVNRDAVFIPSMVLSDVSTPGSTASGVETWGDLYSETRGNQVSKCFTVKRSTIDGKDSVAFDRCGGIRSGDCGRPSVSQSAIQKCQLQARLGNRADQLMTWLASRARKRCLEVKKRTTIRAYKNLAENGKNTSTAHVTTLRNAVSNCVSGDLDCCFSKAYAKAPSFGNLLIAGNIVVQVSLADDPQNHKLVAHLSMFNTRKGPGREEPDPVSILAAALTDKPICEAGLNFITTSVDVLNSESRVLLRDHTDIQVHHDTVETVWALSKSRPSRISISGIPKFAKTDEELEAERRKKEDEKTEREISNNRKTVIISTVSAGAAVVAAVGAFAFCCFRSRAGRQPG